MNDNTYLPSAVSARMIAAYPGLEIHSIEDKKHSVVDDSKVSSELLPRLKLDVEFYARNPHLPLESVCAHLDTYVPRNESQIKLVDYARKLVAYTDESRGAGLFIWGEAGVGKSHIAVGLSKLFMQQGLQPVFMVADKFSFHTDLELESGQVWIIDDLNTGYGLGSRLFKNVVLNIHDRGGRMFITSNKPYQELMAEMFVGEGQAARMRYEDRTKGLFKILQVDGESYRQETAWHLEG